MLSDADRQRIAAEERLKAEIRAALAAANPSPPSGRFAWVGNDSFRWAMTTLAIPLAVFIWGYYTNRLADQDRAAREAVETTQRNVDLVIKLLPAINKEPGTRERVNAIAVLRALETKGELPPELRAAFEQVKEEISQGWQQGKGYTSDAVRKEAEAVADATARVRSDQIEAGTPPPTASGIAGGRVFVQIFDESQRAAAMKLQAALRESGIAVPGIENVTATAIRNSKPVPGGYDGNVLLVFHESDAQLAARIDAIAGGAGIPLVIRDRWKQRDYDDVPAGQFEVWFAKKPSRG